MGTKRKPHFEVYLDKREAWRWRLRASNGRIIACSGEGYEHRTHVYEMVNQMKHLDGVETRETGEVM